MATMASWSVVDREIAPAVAAGVVKRLRQVGLERVLNGSDAAGGGNLPPDEGWASVSRLPLTRAEIARSGSNAVPYWSDRLG